MAATAEKMNAVSRTIARNLKGAWRLFCLSLVVGAEGCVGRQAGREPLPAETKVLHTTLRAGKNAVKADLYFPARPGGAPVMVVAHGFSRSRNNMAGWGRFLAEEGVVAVVPDLPHWSNHRENGRFLAALVRSLAELPELQRHADTGRVGLMGFSAGGLSSLLAAAELPDLVVWIGLDPVDRDGMGLNAAKTLSSPAWILLAEPSSCNANGNGRPWAEALPGAHLIQVEGAVHVDAESPTDFFAERVCGRSTPAKRAAFQHEVRKALTTLKTTPQAP